MLDINMEIRRGILFVRLIGNLNKETSKYFKNEVSNLIEEKGIKYIVINLRQLTNLDTIGADLILDEYRYIAKIDGKVVICGVDDNKKIEKDFFKGIHKSDNELQAFSIINI